MGGDDTSRLARRSHLSEDGNTDGSDFDTQPLVSGRAGRQTGGCWRRLPTHGESDSFSRLLTVRPGVLDDEDRPGPSPPDPTEKIDDPAEKYLEDPAEELAPSVENPADRLPDPSEVDGKIRMRFWTAVFWLDVALAGIVLGPAYALLEGGTRIGAVVTLLGIAAAFRVYQTYRVFQREQADEPTADGSSPPVTDGTAGGDQPGRADEPTDAGQSGDDAGVGDGVSVD